MLGNYSRGMEIKIPARFQDNNKKLVPVDNVTIRIEHFDSNSGNVVHDLTDTLMTQISPSDYTHKFFVPDNMENGSYSIYIKAKIPQDHNKVFEAYESFVIVDKTSEVDTQAQPKISVDKSEEREYIPPKFTHTAENQGLPSLNSNNFDYEIVDTVVDIENNPVVGAHVNVYTRHDFIPGDPNNVKVAGTMTDTAGTFKVRLPKGEYIFVYRSIGNKENREVRKI
jgi:hypothetical protein